MTEGERMRISNSIDEMVRSQRETYEQVLGDLLLREEEKVSMSPVHFNSPCISESFLKSVLNNKEEEGIMRELNVRDLRDYDITDMKVDIIWKENGALITAKASVYIYEHDKVLSEEREVVAKDDILKQLSVAQQFVLQSLDSQLWELEREKEKRKMLEEELAELEN